MSYLVLTLVGIAIGMYLARRNTNAGFNAKQVEQKSQNKQKILAFVQANGRL